MSLKGEQVVTDFLGGKVSERIRGRIDSELYTAAASEMRNVIVPQTGGARSRFGSETLIRYTVPSEGAPRIEPLVIDRDTAFLMVLQTGVLRLYRVQSSGLTIFAGVSAPFNDINKWTLTYEIIGQQVIFCDNSFWPRVLTVNVDAGTMTLQDFEFEENLDGTTSAPMAKMVDEAITLTPSATSGTGVTLTASTAVFDATYVGSEIELRTGRLLVTGYTSPTQLVANYIRQAKERLGPNPFAKKQGNTTHIDVTLVNHELDTGDSITIENAGGISGAVLATDLNTTHTVTGVIDDDTFTIAVTSSGITEDFGGGEVLLTTTAPTRRWKETVFKSRNNLSPPQAVCLHEQRLWFAGSPRFGDDRWASQIGNIYNFDTGTGQDNEAIVSRQISRFFRIRHLVSADTLEIFGDTRMAIQYGSNGTMTPSDQIVKVVEGTSGCSFGRPLWHDGSRIYIDAIGQQARELTSLQEAIEQYASTPLSVTIPEILQEPIHNGYFEGSAVDATPYAIFTNSDGSASFFFSNRQDNVAGWFTLDTPGSITSMAGVGNRLFAGVERFGVYYLEEFSVDGVFKADASETILGTGTPSQSWVANSRFWNRTVSIQKLDGTYVGDSLVGPTGFFTTPILMDDVIIGLPVTYELELMPVLQQTRRGTRRGRKERIVRSFIEFEETTAATVMGKRLARPGNIGEPPTNIPDSYEVRNLGRSRSPRFKIEGNIAERMEALLVILEVT